MAKQIIPARLFSILLINEKKSGKQIKSEKRRKDGSHVVVFTDGGKMIFHQSQHIVRKYPNGSKQQYNPDGTRILFDRHGTRTHINQDGTRVVKPRETKVEADFIKKSSVPLTPKELMAQHLDHAEKTGNSITSDKTTSGGTRKIVFKDGGKLHLHQSGVMIRKFPDGTKVQYNSAGKHTTIDPDGTQTEVNADGTKTVKKSDGSIVKYSKTGKEICVATSAASMPSPETPPKKKHLKKPNLTPPSPSGRGILMIHAAIRLNDVEQATWLIDVKADVNEQDKHGQSPLHIASANGNPGLTALLLEHDSAANQKDKWGETPLHVVSQLAFAEQLEGKSARKPSTASELSESEAEASAACSVAASSASSLSSLPGDALHTQAAEVAKRLLCNSTNAADVNIRDSQGRTPLHAAALRGAYAVCAAIMEHGKVDLAAVDDHGETALHLAIRGGSVDCVLSLLSLLDQASVSDESSSKSAAFDSSALINHANKLKETALHMACMMERSKATVVVCALLYRGAKVRPTDKFGRNALHIWCDREMSVDESEPEKVVQLLLKQYPGLKSERTHTGATPLHLAVARGRVGVMKELMRNGANICSTVLVKTQNVKSKESLTLTPITALRVGKFPAAVRAEVIAEYKKGQTAVATPLDDKAEVLTPPLSSSYSSPRNPIRWCSMIGFQEPTFVSSRERRELMKMLLNLQQNKPSSASYLPNNAAKKCNLCEKKFSLTTRKHHCRHCGHIFCSSCTSNQRAIPKLNIKGKVRVCNTCNTILAGQNESAGPSYSPKSS